MKAVCANYLLTLEHAEAIGNTCSIRTECLLIHDQIVKFY
jgi:hypothetical protein